MRLTAIATIVLALLLAQCGGGGGESEDTPGVADVGADDVPDAGGNLDVEPPSDVPGGDVVAPPDGETQPDVPIPPDVPADVAQDVDAGRVCTGDEECQDLAGTCLVATCQGGHCVVETDPCDDGDDCTLDSCDPATGECRHPLDPACGLCETDADCPDSDANECTDPKCDREAGAARGTCTYVARTGACDDRNACTEDETCTAVDGPRVAVCGGGTAVDCDDDDDDTVDWCDPQATPACRHQSLSDLVACPNGQSDCPGSSACYEFVCDGDAEDPRCQPTERTGACDDGNFCTDPDTCQGGACVAGPPRACGEDETCDPVAGACVPTQQDVPCDTAQDCVDALGPPENTCRQWVCPEALGVCRAVQVPDETSCEDGLFCTVNDSCVAGVCTSGLARVCEGQSVLSDCTCNEEAKACDCIEPPICGEPGCQAAADCDDGDPCTRDSCITFVSPSVCTCTPIEACSCNPNAVDGGAADCDDGDADTVDACVPNTDGTLPYLGLCTHETRPCTTCTGPADVGVCDDDNKCTADVCEPFGDGSFCCANPQVGPPCGTACTDDDDCSDGNPCTPENCAADGTCDPSGPADPTCCLTDEACPEDDNPCTTRRCDTTTGECGFENNTLPCDDGNACTLNDVCGDGACDGEPRTCNDDNECTTDTCDPESAAGCVFSLIQPPPAGCEDCRATPAICNDYHECTADSCDAQTGVCQHLDENEGAVTPRCQPFGCLNDAQCDDGNPCTTDRCGPAEPDPDGPEGPIAPVGGCHYALDATCDIQAGGSTHPLACQTPSDCDPADCVTENAEAYCRNPSSDCPTTLCDPLAGCRFVPNPACPAGECTPATAWRDCWDRIACTADVCDAATLSCLPADERPSTLPADSLYSSCIECGTVEDCPADGNFDRDDPCITVVCLKPAEDEAMDDRGVCHAYVDQALFPNGCEDFDLCTADACLPGGGCTHTPRTAGCEPCVTNGDCDDQNACTVDTCVLASGATQGYQCNHVAAADCIPCANWTDCPDLGTFCSSWVCERGVCQHDEEDPAEGDPCFANADCAAADDCGELPDKITLCLFGTGDCFFLPDPTVTGCQDIADCSLMEPCTRPAGCVDGACVFEPIPGCVPQACTTREECDDGHACTEDVCANGFCVNEGFECCESTSDCSPNMPELLDGCLAATCGPDLYCRAVEFGDAARCGDFCTTDAECTRTCETVVDPVTGAPGPEVCNSFCVLEGPCSAANPCQAGVCDIPSGQTQGRCRVCYDWPCSEGACSASGRCVWFDGDCTGCAGDQDCADRDPCTTDTCVAGACTHTPDPTCAPIACDADTLCDNGDLCSIGVCLTGTCVFLPSPFCSN